MIRIMGLAIILAAAMTGGCAGGGHAVSEPLRQIVFSSDRDGNAEIYVFDSNRALRRITNTEAHEGDPALSPDGSRIAFRSVAAGATFEASEIFIMNSDGTNRTRLTNNEVFDGSPTFSPDGSTIAFGSSPDGNPGIYAMNIDGSNVRPLAVGPNGLPSYCSNDRIAFVSRRDGNDEIYVMNADGSEQRRVTNDIRVFGFPNLPATDWQPACSPDGKSIVFVSNRDGSHFRLYLLDLTTLVVTRLTDSPVQFPVFSPDGTMIAFVQRGIRAMHLDGSGETQVTDHPTDFSPDWR